MVYNPVTYITPEMLKSNNPKRQNKLDRIKRNKYLNLKNIESSISNIKFFYTKNDKNISHVENIKSNKKLNIHSEILEDIFEFNKKIIY